MATKIIIFPGNFLPYIGGLETHVDEFVKHLSKDKNYEITIFAPNCGGKEKEIIHKNVKVIRYPSIQPITYYSFPKLWNKKFWELLTSIYKKDYDIVMTRTRFFPNTVLGFKFAKIRKTPIKLIHVEHGSSYLYSGNLFVTLIARIHDEIFGRIIFNFADQNVVISTAVRKFVKKFTKKPLALIPRGVDFNYQVPRKHYDKKISMIFAGRLYNWKGVENSIKAYLSLPKPLQEKSELKIIGYGSELSSLKKLAKKNKGIKFLGKLKHDDTIKEFLKAHIYVHSSYPGGGLSSALMQAMRAGCAPIASPHEGAKDVIFNDVNGLLLKDNSKKNIANGMITLLEQPELIHNFGIEAEAYIKKNFNWDKSIEKYKKIIHKLI